MISQRISILCVAGVLGLLSISGCRTLSEKTAGVATPPEGSAAQNPDEIKATQMSFDSASGEIRYTLSEPAYVRLRIGLNQGGALLHHFLDWQLRPAGDHVETWDKKDVTGKIDFGNRLDYLLVINCRRAKNLPQPRVSPQLTVSFPDSTQMTPHGEPVVSGVVPLRIAADASDRKWLSETKFEVAMYVDYVFLMEEEAGINPFNFRLDTSAFAEGVHTLTVNVIAFGGEVGTRSLNFYVKRSVN